MLNYDLVPSKDKNSHRLMVMLHGLGDSMEGYRWFPEAMALSWMNYLLVNAPEDYYGGYSWFDFEGDMLSGVRRSRELLFGLLDHFRVIGFPTEQTTFGGFSQGCLMSIEVAVRYPHKLAGVVGVSGFVCGPEQLVTERSPVALEQRLLITHGTRDPIIPFARAKKQIAFLKSAGIRVEWVEFEKAHTIAGEAEMAVIREFVRAGYPGGVQQ
jgi:phospholipase/carboxylesterase